MKWNEGPSFCSEKLPLNSGCKQSEPHTMYLSTLTPLPTRDVTLSFSHFFLPLFYWALANSVFISIMTAATHNSNLSRSPEQIFSLLVSFRTHQINTEANHTHVLSIEWVGASEYLKDNKKSWRSAQRCQTSTKTLKRAEAVRIVNKITGLLHTLQLSILKRKYSLQSFYSVVKKAR